MTMPSRNYESQSSYRYGFNGKEKDLETTGTSTYDYGFRIYNPAIGKFLSVDPLSQSYPFYTPYQYAGNCPIAYIDVDGLEAMPAIVPVKLEVGEEFWSEDEWAAEVKIMEVATCTAPFIKKSQPVVAKQSNWQRFKSKFGTVISIGLDFVPLIGDAKGYIESAIGKDLLTGEKLSPLERGLSAAPFVGSKAKALLKLSKLLKGKKAAKHADEVIEQIVKKSDEVVQQTVKHSDDLLNASKAWSGALSKKLGNAGEEYVQKIYGGTWEVFENTTLGGRRWDVVSGSVAVESKVGYTGLTKRVFDELNKDFELLLKGGGKSEVSQVLWHFTTSGRSGKGGISNPLRKRIEFLNSELEKAGVNGRFKIVDDTKTTINVTQ
jgi:RHS repeat-associated protein